MKKYSCARLLAAFTLAAVAGCSAVADTSTETYNLDFEKELDGWRATEKMPMSRALAEAARGGKSGLRVEDTDTASGSSLLGPQVPVVADADYRFSFWAKTATPNIIGVWVRFYNAERKVIGETPTPLTNVDKGSSVWTAYSKTLRSPANTAYAAFWIHSFSAAQGVCDFDDFAISKIGESAGQSTPTATGVATVASTPAALPIPVERRTPAYIIIKADDLMARNGTVSPQWQKFVDFIKERKIHASIGIVANSLEGDKPEYFRWIKDLQATGLFEFWNHGYDHKTWQDGGKTLMEFVGPSYEQQKEHLENSNRLAKEKLGLTFTTFGSPFNQTDHNTERVLRENTEIVTWLYGSTQKPAGKVVLDRVPDVSIEATTFVPDALKFANGYNRYPDRDVFVLQGHPEHWTPERFAQFVQIIDFLTQAKARFVTPAEYTRLKFPNRLQP